ncbi:hypothetical protein E8E13_000033 [Curvularia kusanoi]|uniref:Glycosyl hydrolase family 13 catalytic domain-containing protein n=1 Tax=Curvularia kusanoi TaxID=90978 RepID=A0A9P4W6L4_CURKU|nr:hypothetical protein E8E13_000033 [Curvularia kusanoi]
MISKTYQWWKDAIVYQVYPASFKDSNGDGKGDLQGIISELDYIKSIGVNVLWICPMYESPQADMGYDISDYEKVYPPYGTMQDMEQLIAECHSRGLKIILDLVINHTSDQHNWFQESRTSKHNPKRNWYIWRPGRYVNGERKPPNNWRSNFGGSAWEWDDATEEYYLHLFAVEQPDLNWENDATRAAIYTSAMRFWLNKGVNGFRVDTVNMYSKGPGMPDAPILDPDEEHQFAGFQYCNGPRMSEFLREMNSILSEYDAMTVGECPNTPELSRVVEYVSAKEDQLNMVFQFDVVELGVGPFKFQTIPKNWRLSQFKEAVARTQSIITGTDAWTTAFLENHDQPRSISRFASDAIEHRIASGKMLALMLVSLSGTLFIYQGQEIGMINGPSNWDIDEYKDVESRNYYQMVYRNSGGDQRALADALTSLQHLARDHARIPMPWDSSDNRGFSQSKSWMRLNDDHAICNVQQQQEDTDSVLAFWKQALKVRTANADVLIHGDFSIVDDSNNSIFTFTKVSNSRKVLVTLNFSDQPQSVLLPDKTKILFSTHALVDSSTLQAFEGRIYLY